MNNDILINGKVYPMWQQFVQRKEEFIGGRLEDFGDSFDKAMGLTDDDSGTEITDIILAPNGTDSAYFTVKGKEFSCGFDVLVGGITAGENGWITFSGYMGHEWRIKSKS